MKRIKRVHKDLYRGSAPSPRDIMSLNRLGLNSILSLDENAANDIAPMCKELGIKHTVLPINLFDTDNTLDLLGKHNLSDLLQGKTLVHCRQGKDRTGLLIALFRTMMDGWTCRKAIREAKEQGFGTGVSLPIQEFFSDIIHASCTSSDCTDHDDNDEEDHNDAMTAADYSHDSQFTDNAYYGIAPYMDYDSLPYGHATDVSTTYQNRADYQISGITDDMPVSTQDLPQVGTYDNQSAYTNLFGPAVLPGEFE